MSDLFLFASLATLIVVLLLSAAALYQIVQTLGRITTSQGDITRNLHDITIAQKEQTHVLQDLMRQVAVMDARQYPNE